MARLPFRKGVIRADAVRPGDTLWSELRGRLLVVAVEHVPTPEILYGKHTGRTIDTVRLGCLTVTTQTPIALGNFRPESELQLVKRARPRVRGGGREEGPSANKP